MPVSEEDLQKIKNNFQWPESRPDFNPVSWILDGGGRHIILEKINKNDNFLIIEIGSFLGSSSKLWSDYSENVYVIAIDPWEDGWPEQYAKKHGRYEVAKQFSRKNGLYMTFLSSLWEYRHKIFPLRGKSPDVFNDIAKLNLKPDLMYFDAEKDGMDIEVAHKLFPDAIIAGDDWTWGIDEGYPIRKAVRSFIKKYKYNVATNKATWIIKKTNLNFKDRFYNLLNNARDLARKFKSYFKKLF